MLPFLTRIHPDPKQPCFPIGSIAGLRSSNTGTENETTAEQIDKIFRIFYYFPTHCKKHLWAASAHPAHVQAFEKLLRTIRPPSTGKHRTFTRSWQTPSLTVLVLRCCSDSLIQNLQKHAPLTETKRLQTGLQMQLLRRAIAKSCKGLQAKHRYVLAAWLKSAGL